MQWPVIAYKGKRINESMAIIQLLDDEFPTTPQLLSPSALQLRWRTWLPGEPVTHVDCRQPRHPVHATLVICCRSGHRKALAAGPELHWPWQARRGHQGALPSLHHEHLRAPAPRRAALSSCRHAQPMLVGSSQVSPVQPLGMQGCCPLTAGS